MDFDSCSYYLYCIGTSKSNGASGTICPEFQVSQNEGIATRPIETLKEQGIFEKEKKGEEEKLEEGIYYYNCFFSPKETAESLKRRNDNLELLNFEKSDEEPDDVFNRRKKKMADLMSKEEEQLQALLQIREVNEGKFDALIKFIKFFSDLKSKQIRTDYYSNKTFCALKNASESELLLLTKIMHTMYINVMREPKIQETRSESTSCQSSDKDERTNEFLILPRFFISKEKILRLCKDENLQKNFEFLIFHECLGHYNNEANKKMPEETQMVYVRELLAKKFGREKFKKICSINHGNKFLKNQGSSAYFDLYLKSLEYLRQLDNYIKKGKKYESIKKELDKIPVEQDEFCGMSSLSESESSNSIYSFRSIDECLNKIEKKSKETTSVNSEMLDEPRDVVEIEVEMKKKGIKRLSSMPLEITEEGPIQPRGFCVRKSQTLQTKTTENIILISPPQPFEV